jgi:hypothetical protein
MLGEGDEGASLPLLAHRTQQHFLPAHTAVRAWFTEGGLDSKHAAERKRRSERAADAILSRTLDLLTLARMEEDALVG